jgi:hypothetical protein
MNPPLKVGALLSSRYAPIDALIADPPVLATVLRRYAPKAAEEQGVALPDTWTVDVTVSKIITNRWSDERVLRLEGVVIPA